MAGNGCAMDYELNRIIDKVNATNSRAVITSSMREKIREAVHRLTYAFSNHVKIQHVKEGFRDSDVFPPSLRKIRNQLFGNQYQDFQEYIALEEKAQIAVEPFIEESVLTEEYMDELDIRKSPDNNNIPRDQRALHNNRARVLNTAGTVAMFLSRRGVVAEQLQLNTTYSRAAQERMRAKEADLAAEREKMTTEKAATAARRALELSQKRDERLAMNPREVEQFLRQESSYQRRKERMRQTRGLIRAVEVAVSGNDSNSVVTNNDVTVPRNVELPTDVLQADDLHTDEHSTNALHTDGLRLIDNIAYMERINDFRNTSSSSFVVIPTASSSSSGRRIRLPSALPGDFTRVVVVVIDNTMV